MAWSICELSLPAKARLRKRDIDYIAVTAGNCAPKICELSLPPKNKERKRDIDFIAIPFFTEVRIAELSLPAKGKLRKRDIDFIAVSIDCGGIPIPMECAPIQLTMSGSADFGDFDIEMSKQYVVSDESGSEEEYFSDGELYRSVTYHWVTARQSYLRAGRNAFYNPDSSKVIREDDMRLTLTTTSSGDGVTDVRDYEFDSLEICYKREKATVSPDSTWVPLDFFSENKYLKTYVGASSYTIYRYWEKNSQLLLNVANHSEQRSIRTFGHSDVTKDHWRHYNLETQIPEVPEVYYKSDKSSIIIKADYNVTNSLGTLSTLAGFFAQSDVTYKGEPIDLSRVPTPCNFVSDAIIKLDGVAPSIVKSNNFTGTDIQGSDEYSETPQVFYLNSARYDAICETATGIGSGMFCVQNMDWYWIQQGSGYDWPEGFFSYNWRSNSSYQKPIELGMLSYIHRQDGYTESLPSREEFNWQRSMKFVMQLGPIYMREYDQDEKLGGGNEDWELSGYKNSRKYELVYKGVGWGIYLVNPFKYHALASNEPEIWGPFSYTTHLSKYFEFEDGDNYPKFKDANYDEPEELQEVVDDFYKQPNEVQWTKSTHGSDDGSPLMNYHAILPYAVKNSNTYERAFERKVGSLSQSWVGLNPFGTPNITVTDYSKSKPPEGFRFHYLYIFDNDWTYSETREEDDPIFEALPQYSSALALDFEESESDVIWRYDPVIYIEYNWDHREKKWVFSTEDEHTTGLKGSVDDGGTTGWNQDGDDLFVYAIDDTRKMPTGSISVTELPEIDNDGNQWQIDIEWNQPQETDNSGFLYLCPFKDGRRSVKLNAKIPPIKDNEPYFVAQLPNGINISNISPLNYKGFLNRLQIVKDSGEYTEMGDMLRAVGWEPAYVKIE